MTTEVETAIALVTAARGSSDADMTLMLELAAEASADQLNIVAVAKLAAPIGENYEHSARLILEPERLAAITAELQRVPTVEELRLTFDDVLHDLGRFLAEMNE